MNRISNKFDKHYLSGSKGGRNCFQARCTRTLGGFQTTSRENLRSGMKNLDERATLNSALLRTPVLGSKAWRLYARQAVAKGAETSRKDEHWEY